MCLCGSLIALPEIHVSQSCPQTSRDRKDVKEGRRTDRRRVTVGGERSNIQCDLSVVMKSVPYTNIFHLLYMSLLNFGSRLAAAECCQKGFQSLDSHSFYFLLCSYFSFIYN